MAFGSWLGKIFHLASAFLYELLLLFIIATSVFFLAGLIACLVWNVVAVLIESIHSDGTASSVYLSFFVMDSFE